MAPLSGILLFCACAIAGGCACALHCGRWPHYEKWHAVTGLVAMAAIWVIVLRSV